MSAPFYFLTTPAAATLVSMRAAKPLAHALPIYDRLGLACVVSHHYGRLVAQPLRTGPSGLPGLLLQVHNQTSGPPQKVGYYPDEQTWHHVRRFPDGVDELGQVSGIHVGWAVDDPPTPGDLDNGNPHNVPALPVELSDGHEWMMPQLREPCLDDLPQPTNFHRPRLPTTLGHSLDGGFTRKVKRQFVDLWDESAVWFDTWMKHLADGKGKFNVADAVDFVVRCLQLRYRLPSVLCDALELIDSNQLQELVDVAIDFPAIMQTLRERLDEAEGEAVDADDDQKKSPDSAPAVNGDCGPGDSDHTTDPHEPNNTWPSTVTLSTVGANSQ